MIYHKSTSYLSKVLNGLKSENNKINDLTISSHLKFAYPRNRRFAVLNLKYAYPRKSLYLT